jgi:hypothetical protein
MLESNQTQAFFGTSVSSAGDVNGDGYSDLVVGAPGYDHGTNDEGSAFVFHGGSSGIPSGNVSSASTLIESNLPNGFLGGSVASAGDVDRDGYGDVIVGVPFYAPVPTSSGGAFVFRGSPSGLIGTTPGTAATAIVSTQIGGQFGMTVASAGDVNGDGYSDVIVGAPLYQLGAEQAGAAFVFRGGPSGIPSTSPSGASGKLDGVYQGSQFGRDVSTAGDLNADGYSDVIVGAPNYTGNLFQQGAVFVFRGGPVGIPDNSADGAYASFASDDAGSHLGAGVTSAGDVNGDGVGDVAFGAPAYEVGPDQTGAVFVYLGYTFGNPSFPAWTQGAMLTCAQPTSLFGEHLAGAGDINGDGYSDLVVGAPAGGATDDEAGDAYVFLGGGDAGKTLAGGGRLGRAVRALQSAPDEPERFVQPWGAVDADRFDQHITITSSSGRQRVKVETEACPPGVPFGSPSCVSQISPTWTDVTLLPGGVEHRYSVGGFTSDALYRWRARLLFAPYSVDQTGITPPPEPPHGPWRRLAAQSDEADLRLSGGSPVAVSPSDFSMGFAIDRVVPNPAKDGLTVSFVLPKAGPARIGLYDVAGRRRLARTFDSLEPGPQTVRLSSLGSLPPGLYLLRIEQGERSASTKIVLR